MTLSEIKQKTERNVITDRNMISSAVIEFVNLPSERLYKNDLICSNSSKNYKKGDKASEAILRMIKDLLCLEETEADTVYELTKKIADFRSNSDPHTDAGGSYERYCSAITLLSTLYKGFIENPGDEKKERIE